MTEKPDAAGSPSPVPFVVASSMFEARVIVAVLEDAGIPAFVPGGALVDEFAMSQRLMNLQGVNVEVPSDRLEDARAALAAAKRTEWKSLEELAVASATDADAEVESVSRPESTSPARPRPGLLLATVLSGLLAVFFAVKWLDARAELTASQASEIYDFQSTVDGWTWRWKHNGELAARIVDQDRNGIIELHWAHNRDGTLVSLATDADQNGMFEQFEYFDELGRSIAVMRDADEDGWYEHVREVLADGTTIEHVDTNDDLRLDRLTIFDGQRATLVQELRGPQGFVRTQ